MRCSRRTGVSGRPPQITRRGGASFAPAFTPDGKRIIFASNFPQPRSGNVDLFVVIPEGMGLERITLDREFDGFPMVSSDGRRQVWASSRKAAVRGETNLFIAGWVP